MAPVTIGLVHGFATSARPNLSGAPERLAAITTLEDEGPFEQHRAVTLRFDDEDCRRAFVYGRALRRETSIGSECDVQMAVVAVRLIVRRTATAQGGAGDMFYTVRRVDFEIASNVQRTIRLNHLVERKRDLCGTAVFAPVLEGARRTSHDDFRYLIGGA
jgi:hypothetical protein